MAMLIAWAFCNRGRNPGDERFPNAGARVLPEPDRQGAAPGPPPQRPDNYYAAFDIVPAKLRPLMQNGKVIVENWHGFAPESDAEGGKSGHRREQGCRDDRGVRPPRAR